MMEINTYESMCPCNFSISDVYLFGDIGNPEEYFELLELLRESSSDDTVNIHINTDGGSLDTADIIYNFIVKSEARVKAHVYGIVASAGTIIALGCDDIEASLGTKFVMHLPQLVDSYDSILSTSDKWQSMNNQFLTKVYKEILTEEELSSLLLGEELLLGSDELEHRFYKEK